MERVVLIQRKCSQNRLSNKQDVQSLSQNALSGSHGDRWGVSFCEYGDAKQQNGLWVITYKITFAKTSGKEDLADKQFQKIISKLSRLGAKGKFIKYPWKIIKGAEGYELNSSLDNDIIQSHMEQKIGNINLDPKNYFDDIYEREHQKKIVMSALEIGKKTDWKNRYHVLLEGPPGSAKTELMTAFQKMLGEEGYSYFKFDATQMTGPGARKFLMEQAVRPPVVFVEEIEKPLAMSSEAALSWMLSIMDDRAEIRVTNARVGHQTRSLPMLMIASCNNIKLLEGAMSGALFSRFSHVIHCPSPSTSLLYKILEREVRKVNGNPAWIKPCLDFCCEKYKMIDPRKIIPKCICGGDKWLDGTYQEALEATMSPISKSIVWKSKE